MSPFLRVIYADDPALVLGRAGAERAYGAPLLIVPTGVTAPARPRGVRGTVLHLDPTEDPRWVQGDSNPMLEWAAVKERLSARFPGVGDVDDKWHEHRLLNHVAAEVAPPRTELAAVFGAEPPSADERAAAAAAVLPYHAQAARAGVPVAELARLELLRCRMRAALGEGLLKSRTLCSSEGRLPSTADDWALQYLQYVTRARPVIERLQREVEGSSDTLESKIKDLPHVKGRVLEQLLLEPARVVVQKRLKIAKEVRVHVVEGRILAGATFLRFYPPGRYLRAREVDLVEGALKRHLLDRLPPDAARFSCSCDVVLEEATGQVTIIDLNAGLESGYYFPEEDVFTTNLLAARFTGQSTPFLDAFARAVVPGPRRARRLQKLFESISPITTGDVQEAFWDRVLAVVAQDVMAHPDGDTVRAVRAELAAAGLKRESIFRQFLSWVRDTFPDLERQIAFG